MFSKRLYRMIAHLDESFEELIVNVDKIRMNTIDATHEQNNNFVAPQQSEAELQAQSQSQSELMMEENIITNRIERNRINQTEIVNMMAKVSLLTIISVIFMNVYFIAIIYFLFDFRHNPNQDSISVYQLVARIELIIGLCWNCFTLYATFPFNDKQYVKCCGLCHKGLKYCCIACVTKRILRQRR